MASSRLVVDRAKNIEAILGASLSPQSVKTLADVLRYQTRAVRLGFALRSINDGGYFARLSDDQQKDFARVVDANPYLHDLAAMYRGASAECLLTRDQRSVLAKQRHAFMEVCRRHHRKGTFFRNVFAANGGLVPVTAIWAYPVALVSFAAFVYYRVSAPYVLKAEREAIPKLHQRLGDDAYYRQGLVRVWNDMLTRPKVLRYAVARRPQQQSGSLATDISKDMA